MRQTNPDDPSVDELDRDLALIDNSFGVLDDFDHQVRQPGERELRQRQLWEGTRPAVPTDETRT